MVISVEKLEMVEPVQQEVVEPRVIRLILDLELVGLEILLTVAEELML